ncbi:hypothetical protein Tco_1014300 [Tanacetum coccineum]
MVGGVKQICWGQPLVPFSLSVDLNIKYLKSSLAEDNSTSALQIQGRNANHVRDSELVSLFGKLKYEENLIDSIYDTKKKKSLTTATPLSTAFFSTSIIQDFQDNLDDEEDTRNNEEEVSSDDNKIVEVKVLMALIDDESGAVGKGSATNRE